ncbi:MAG: DUF4421 domain-containing protein [Prevotella sp.]|nr:DUF4421 domain-containing protein [Prevotella sp.]
MTLTVKAADSLEVEKPQKKNWLRRTIQNFTEIDENYVEPQHYNWSAMLQATYNYDIYTLNSDGQSKQSLTFAPEPSMKAGPYFGWRWVFLGYTFDLKNLNFGSNKQGFEFSFYAAQVGVDVFYRRTGSDYKIRNVDIDDNQENELLENHPFDGLKVGITGFNLYYIFNHKRFSYPAAFSQSTCQKISCGSWMAGIGYMTNNLSFDHERLERMVEEQYGKTSIKLDSSLMFNEVKYFDINASVGYAYNWVFARNCLFCASLSVALAYKNSWGETASVEERGFDIKNFNIDGIGRFGIVYNNMRWYAGASVIVRSYNYHKSRFSANNTFGNMNIYIGYNFGKRKRYK